MLAKQTLSGAPDGLRFCCGHTAFLQFVHVPLLPFALLQGMGSVFIPKQKPKAQQINIDMVLLMIAAHARGAALLFICLTFSMW